MSIVIQNLRPGVVNLSGAAFRKVMRTASWARFQPGNAQISGAYARDPDNPSIPSGGSNTGAWLRPGLVLGRRTADSLLASSFIGDAGSTGTIAGNAVTITLSAADAVEIVRRIGSSGTFKLTGAPAASGTVRTVTVTFSAVNVSTGAVTITAIGVNEVQTLTFGAAATGGTMRLRVPMADGTFVTTDAITWNGTDATWLASINTALDTATGVVGGIVATGAAPDTALTFTFSGTGYANLPQPVGLISVVTFPTSTTTATVVRTTTGVDGRFLAGSLPSAIDGSETPLTFLPDGYPLRVTDENGTSIVIYDALVPSGGDVFAAQMLPYSAQTEFNSWLRKALNGVTAAGVSNGKAATFNFDTDWNG